MMTGILTLASSNPIEHVINHPTLVVDGWWVWSSIQTNLVLTGLILLIGWKFAARHIATGDESEGHDRYLTKHPVAGLIEVVSVFLREEICRPVLGERTDRFMPFLWTLFYFILLNNLLGLVPLVDLWHLVTDFKVHWVPAGGTATQSIYVTGALALVSFFVINAAGIRELGVGGYLKHLTGGTSGPVALIMVPIEILSTFIKPVALAVRLFANMTAGHILVATLFMFVGMVINAGVLIAAPVSLASAGGAIAIYFLELFVAFIQAFVFMFLTTVFIGQLSHHGEHESHGSHEPQGAPAGAVHG